MADKVFKIGFVLIICSLAYLIVNAVRPGIEYWNNTITMSVRFEYFKYPFASLIVSIIITMYAIEKEK